MNEPNENSRVRDVFEAAAEFDGKERDAFLRQACGNDEKLRAEVESLLGAVEGAGEFLKDPVIEGFEAFTAAVELQEGDVIDEYRLLEKIGEGGNSIVYMVEQIETLRRRAAMKVIKLGMDTREVIARFEVERQALALMDHPNIAKVFDAGMTATGRPYFIMELVKGIPITDYCDLNNLSTRERLELFLQVCLALQHAHLKGIIHRDVKPSNILVTLHDGTPVPKVIDFGIAKATEARLTEKTLFTRFHQFIGTPAYMSPEQAEMSGLDVDTRSDVYSLGVLLYELITGSTPFDGRELLDSGYAGIQKVIREEEPDRPSTRLRTLSAEGLTAVSKNRRIGPGGLSRDIKGDLDWIVMKALEKDRTRRYDTATELVRDIRRHLDDEPVEAGPRGKAYHLGKFVRRHRSMAAAGSAIFATLVAGTLVSTFLWQRAVKETAEANRQAERATQVAGLLNTMFQSAGPEAAKGSDFTVRHLLDDFSNEFTGALDIDPEVEVTVRQTVGTAYEGLGDYVQAEPHARRAHHLAAQLFGEESAPAMQSLSLLGWLSYHLGGRADGLAFLTRAEAYQDEHLGLANRDYQRTLCCLAHILLDDGRTDEAKAVATRVFDATSPERGADPDPMHLWSARTLARVFQSQGKPRDAEALFGSLLKASENAPEIRGQHPRTIEAMHTICRIRIDLGELGKAHALATKAHQAALRTLGADHRTSLLLLSDLALIAKEKGNLGQALESFQHILQKQRAHLGDQHQDTIESMLALAAIQQARGQHPEANRLVNDAYRSASGTFGSDAGITLESLGQLAETLAGQGRFFEAQQVFERVYSMANESLGPAHETTLHCAQRLARFEMQRGNATEADQLHNTILERRRAAQGEDGEQTLDSLHEYAIFLREAGRYSEALSVARDLCEGRRRTIGEQSAKTIASIKELGAIEKVRGVEMEAIRHLDEAAKLARLHLGNEHPLTLEIIWDQIEARRIVGANKEASLLLAAARQLAEATLEPDHELAVKIAAESETVQQTLADIAHRAEEARKGYERAVAAHGSESEHSFKERNRLIEILLPVHDARAECERLIQHNIDESTQIFGPDHVQTLRAFHLRSQAAERWGQDSLAEKYYAQIIDTQREAGLLRQQRSLTTHYLWSEFLIQRGRHTEADAILDRWQDEINDIAWPTEREEILLPRRSEWRFRRFLKHQNHDWRTVDETELTGSWRKGLGPFGYGIRGIGTMPLTDGDRRAYFTTCFRREFEVEDPAAFSSIKLRLRHEDGAAVYINGEEVARSNLYATSVGGTSALGSSYAISRNAHFCFMISPDQLVRGRNIVAVQLHQTSIVSSHMVFDLEIQGLRNE